ncbi:hypothetical protein C1646_677445 [Rhizophagus diaphanus]|nr:hypothetical protein C1646_677445 [Rhizophagus diaphanus] [Rhizophagus sp. MUCL 43196]
MMLSLNCLILGQASDKSFTENIGKTYYDDSNVEIDFSYFKVSHFKEKLFREQIIKNTILDKNEMDLWKVNSQKVDDEEKKLEEFTEDDIKDKLEGEKMISRYLVSSYFKVDQKMDVQGIHIFVVPTSTGKCLPIFYLSNKEIAITKYRFGLIDLFLSAHARKRKAEEEYGRIAPKRRTFAAANEAYPEYNFFIDPEADVEILAQLLLNRKFTLLFGHRQSGKSTTCHAILRWFDDHPEKIKEAGFDPQELEFKFVTFDSTVKTDNPSVFWKCVCTKLRTIDRKLFNFNTDEECTSFTFQELFSKSDLLSPKQIILIVDEASRMSINDECTIEFIDSLRTLKGDLRNFRLISIMLVGTESIRDFLVTHQKPNSVSKISPFTADASLTCRRFTKADVENLFKQFADVIENFDYINIASDVFELTLGHKGLVGACGDYIQNTYSCNNDPIQTLDDWKKHTPIKLMNRIKEMATYQSIVRCIDTLSYSHRSILIKVLRFGTCAIDISDESAKFLLAEGMIFAKQELKNGNWRTEIAAPILRSLIISTIALQLSIPNNPPDINTLDPRWLLERTIENLCIRNLYSEETLNANEHPSEYAFQSEFSIVFKNILGKVYESLRYRVLVEAKEYEEGDTRRQRLDLLIRDGSELPSYGFELVVSASKANFKNHLKRSQHYGKIHNCTMFMVNLCPKPTLSSYFGENDEQFEDNDEDEKVEEYEEYEEHKEIAVNPVNVIIKKKMQKAWQGEIKYKDGKSEVVSIIDSKWNMLFRRKLVNMTYRVD